MCRDQTNQYSRRGLLVIILLFLASLIAGHVNAQTQETKYGTNALDSRTTGDYNTAVGYDALTATTSGSSNTATGVKALGENTTGSYNSATGGNAMGSNTTGNYNVGAGYDALAKNTTGSYNTATGMQALEFNTTGDDNTASGYNALYANTTGESNTALGTEALSNNTTGSNNTAIGLSAGDSNITGSGNVFIGYAAGYNETGSNKLYIDNSTTTAPLIYGDFNTNEVKINGGLEVTGALTVVDPTAPTHAANKRYVDNLRSDMHKYDNQTVALTAALSSLPTNGGTGTHACGIGMGHRGQASAMGLGCAADFSSLGLSEHLPNFVRDASINAGTSFLTADDPTYTFKVGLTFNFGGPKTRTEVSRRDWRLDNRLAQLEQKNHQRTDNQAQVIDQLRQENLKIQAKLDELKRERSQEVVALKAKMEQIVILLGSPKVLAIKGDHGISKDLEPAG